MKEVALIRYEWSFFLLEEIEMVWWFLKNLVIKLAWLDGTKLMIQRTVIWWPIATSLAKQKVPYKDCFWFSIKTIAFLYNMEWNKDVILIKGPLPPVIWKGTWNRVCDSSAGLIFTICQNLSVTGISLYHVYWSVFICIKLYLTHFFPDASKVLERTHKLGLGGNDCVMLNDCDYCNINFLYGMQECYGSLQF